MQATRYIDSTQFLGPLHISDYQNDSINGFLDPNLPKFDYSHMCLALIAKPQSLVTLSNMAAGRHLSFEGQDVIKLSK